MGLCYTMVDVNKWVLWGLTHHALKYSHRAGYCFRHRVKSKHVIVNKTPDNAARYGNLALCKSVWACPMCGARIAQARADELAIAVTKWMQGGGFVAMVTYTHRHHKKDALGANLALLKASYKKMLNHRSYRNLRKLWGHQAQAYEITRGPSGWHVHIHTLLFMFAPPPPKLENNLYNIWSIYVDAKRGVGVNVQTRQDKILARYISKVDNWGIAAELALGDKKEGGDSYMVILLRGEFDLVREYAEATAGYNKLTLSRGLRDAFGLHDLSDSDILALEERPASFLFATIPDELWAMVVNALRDKRQDVLELAELAQTEEEFIMMIESELDNGTTHG